MVKSIFDLEKRTDLKKETLRIASYLSQDKFMNIDFYEECTFEEVINDIFEQWPDRYTATTISEYFELINLNKNVISFTEEEYFYYLQFIFDFIKWLSKYKQKTITSDTEKKLERTYSNNEERFSTVIKNIQIIAELSNYKIEKIASHYTFVKRDSDVDSILSIIENEDDLRLTLLEYNDFRIENNKDEKKKLIIKIGQYIEANKKEYKEKNKNLFKQISNILNNYNIRHSNENQVNAREADVISIYNICFNMMIHLIRDSYIKDAYSIVTDTYQKNRG